MTRPRQTFRHLPEILLLALLALAALQPVLDNGFVNLDDGTYLTHNTRVLGGITWDGVAWAATTRHAANWHPLTWLSLMADVQLFGVNARGHHGVNLLFHLANTFLLFATLAAMTGARWRSFFVAALFAVHPLHVESVAWVSERKDVLSTFFWMLTMGSFLWYARRPRPGRFLVVVVFFAAGLMSKPMLVTLPFVLLLLDYWPLGRLRDDRRRVPDGTAGHPSGPPARRLVLEKWPLFVLSGASSIITYRVQQEAGAVALLGELSFGQRVTEAILAYGGYVGKALWPRGLSAFYASPGITWPDWRVVACLLLVLGVCALSIAAARRQPQLLVGWLWFLGTLVPVIGIVKVGAQVMADRYTYVPLIGLGVMAVWSLGELERRVPFRKAALGTMGGAILVALTVLSRQQAGYWKDSASLFGHALSVSPDNWAAHHMYALALAKQGNYAEAIAHSIQALRMNFDEAQLEKLGTFLEARNKTGEAAELYAKALELYPGAAGVRYRLANVQNRQGDYREAILNYERVLKAEPDHGYAHNNLGIALFRTGKAGEAIAHYREALRVDPRNAEAHNNLGFALRGQGLKGEAEAEYREALRDRPGYALAMRNLAEVLQEQGRGDESALWRDKARDAESEERRAREELAGAHR